MPNRCLRAAGGRLCALLLAALIVAAAAQDATLAVQPEAAAVASQAEAQQQPAAASEQPAAAAAAVPQAGAAEAAAAAAQPAATGAAAAAASTEQQQPAAAAAAAASTEQQQPAAAAAAAAQQPAAEVAAAAEQQQPAAAAAGAAAGPSTVDSLYMCADKLNNATIVEQLPQLKIEQVLDTNKPRSPQDVTLVTQLSFERLYMLEGQCDVWNGVISAAVYIALLNGKAVTVELNSNQNPRLADISEVEEKFKKFHQLAEAKGLCKLDLQLVSQNVESIWLSALYPVNAMRNRALANARTEAVLLLDVDFWPSAELSELMQKPAKYASLMTALQKGSAVVLPAYETGDPGDIGVEVAREAVLEGKDAAVKMFWDGRIKAFHTDRYEAGHRATDYKRWLDASRPYNIQYEEGFEPYIIVARRFVPWYDERFVGYRKNKVVHLLYLSTSGIQFVVHPRAFTVHSPHPRARTWKVTHKTGLWDQLAEIYDQAKVGMLAGSYIPAAMYSCGEHLAGPQLAQRPTFGTATA